MGADRKVVVEIVGDPTKFTKALDAATGKAGKFSNVIKGVGQGIGIGIVGAMDSAASAVIGFVGDSITAASDMNETVSKIGVVFGKASEDVIDWGFNAAEAMGMSQNSALAAAATYGNLFVSLGITGEKAGDMSTKMVELAGDLASFNNASPEETLAAIQSGLVGETEPLRKFGISLNDAALRQEALALGLSDGKSVLDANTKAQAAYSLILKQSTTAQGDFARTSGGLANQQRIAQAKMEDLSATIGAKLLPVIVTIESFLVDSVIPAFFAVADAIGPIITQVAGALIPVFQQILPIFGAVVGALGEIWSAIQPVVAAVANALIPIIKRIMPVVQSVFGAVVGIVKALAPAFKVVFSIIGATLEAFFTVLSAIFDAIGVAVDVLSKVFKGLGDFIGGVFRLVAGIVRNAINGVIRIINGVIGAINAIQVHIHVGPVDLDWNGLNIRKLPTLHQGGVVPGSPGSEVLTVLQAGETVTPVGGGPGQTIIIHIDSFIGSDSDIDRFADKVARRLRTA